MSSLKNTLFCKNNPLKISENEILQLCFVKSLDISVYPCGRRNSTIIEQNPNTRLDDYYYPFDPEARLNTEYNNRHITGINGFTHTFIKNWRTFEDSGPETSAERANLEIVLGGYSFRIPECTSPDDFGKAFKNFIFNDVYKNTDAKNIPNINKSNKIYANIRLEKVPLYSSLNALSIDVSTWILRNQSDTVQAEPSLDRLINTATPNSKKDESEATANYYFSGLSFTATPIADFESTKTIYNKDDIQTYGVKFYSDEENRNEQVVISLCMLEYDSDQDKWLIYQPSLLPNIRHGALADQIEVTHIYVEGDEYLDGDLTVEGNIKANWKNKLAHFYNITVDNDALISGNITANSTNKLAKFYDVTVDRYLEVANTIDTKNLIASDVQVTGDISRVHGTNKIMGLVTMEAADGINRTDEDNTAHTRKRLTFYTKLPGSTPVLINRPALIEQPTNP